MQYLHGRYFFVVVNVRYPQHFGLAGKRFMLVLAAVRFVEWQAAVGNI